MADENKNHEVEVDEFTGVETTGHSWDGIKELNNPLPRWWLWTFYLTIVFAIGYSIAYPAWPLIHTSTKGVLGWSSRGALSKDLKASELANVGLISQIRSADVTDVAASPELKQLSISAGKAAFKVNCIQCHGSGAEGSPGYPNLNDDDWLWGGTLDEIYTTLQHGIRYQSDEDTRISDMPAFGADEILSKQEISDVAWYVRKISGQDTDAAAAEKGAVIFTDNCAACHGDNGEGIRELGAPRLSDALWLYGGGHEQIVAQITKPKQGVMPAWAARLGNVTTKQLAVYVHSLGGGE